MSKPTGWIKRHSSIAFIFVLLCLLRHPSASKACQQQDEHVSATSKSFQQQAERSGMQRHPSTAINRSDQS
jgi:hypothetical protein